jgi:predicted phage tail protein
MITVFLYGSLGKEFGAEFRLNVRSAHQAVRLLDVNFGGRVTRFMRHRKFHVVRGADLDGRELTPEQVNLGSQEDLHVLPVGCGAAVNKGLLSVILGTVLIAGAIIASGGTLAAPLASLAAIEAGSTYAIVASVGISMVLGGIMQLVSPLFASDYPGRDDSQDQKSGFLSPPTNSQQQGMPVPLVYGRCRCGTVLVSAGVSSEKVTDGDPGGGGGWGG